MTVDRTPLLNALGVELPDDVLTVALTHRSYAFENGGLPTNERMEFLGDAVLGLPITDNPIYPTQTAPKVNSRRSVTASSTCRLWRRSAADSPTTGLGAHLLLGRAR